MMITNATTKELLTLLTECIAQAELPRTRNDELAGKCRAMMSKLMVGKTPRSVRKPIAK